MKHTPSFLGQNEPLITCMIQADTPKGIKNLIRTGALSGCDAYGLQQEALPREHRTEQEYAEIFEMMRSKPIYVTNYRSGFNKGCSDDELADGLLKLRGYGATLLDIPSDFFCPDPIQLTRDPEAVRKQAALADKIHAAGGEVLFSAHTFRFMTGDEVLAIAKAQKERGADIAKIVTAANSDAEELENLRTTARLREELDIPFLFLSIGTHNKLHRQIGPYFGSCMWLTVAQYDEFSTRAQPLTSAIRAIADHFDH